MNTFDPAMALVSHTGRVFWTRPGTLDVLCRFSGLIAFPYGEFSCPIEVGGWISGGIVQGLASADTGCADFDREEETAMSSYQVPHTHRTRQRHTRPHML